MSTRDPQQEIILLLKQILEGQRTSPSSKNWQPQIYSLTAAGGATVTATAIVDQVPAYWLIGVTGTNAKVSVAHGGIPDVSSPIVVPAGFLYKIPGLIGTISLQSIGTGAAVVTVIALGDEGFDVKSWPAT